MKWFAAPAALFTAAVLALPGASQETKVLNVGDPAPDFKLMGTDGKTYTLDQFKGKSAVVIAWYPRALTGG